MNKKFKIIHITSPGNRTAGRLVFDIHEKLLLKGHVSFIITKAELHEEMGNVYSYSNRLLDTMNRYRSLALLRINRIFGLNIKENRISSFLDLKEDRCQMRYNKIVKKFPFKPDIVILYALQNFINSSTIKKIHESTGAKLYWLIYDAAPLTGGCHYPFDCEGYKNNCGKCPQLNSAIDNDVSRKNWLFKKKHLSVTDISVIAGSEWTKIKAEESSLFRDNPVFKWLVPVKTLNFDSTKDQIRSELHIPSEKKVILFGATSVNNERKGIKYLTEALHILKNENIVNTEKIKIVVIGTDDGFDLKTVPFDAVSTGFISNRETLIKYFVSADVVVVPSIEDAGPFTINESISHGTPVVAFDTGVAKDLIIDGKTGYKAILKNSRDLAEKILKIINIADEERNEFSRNCRELGKRELDYDLQIDKLVEKFEKID